MTNHEKFLEQVLRVKNAFLSSVERDNLSTVIITHHDADGVAAAAILARALGRAGIPFQARIVKYLDLDVIDDLLASERHSKFFVFLDIGSDQLDAIRHDIRGSRCMVLDHHEFHVKNKDEGDDGKILHLNPWMYDIDGSVEVSSSGMVYFFAKAMNVANIDSSVLGIVGALGDEQNTGHMGKLVGLNERMVSDAVKAGIIKEEMDVQFFGRFTRPIHLALSGTIDPYFPGLSGNPDASRLFLEGLGLPLVSSGGKQRPRTISDLSKKEKSRLVSALVERSLKTGMNPDQVKRLVGFTYTVNHPGDAGQNELGDLREFAALLNACGRMGDGGVALAVALGNRSNFLVKAQKTMGEFIKELGSYVNWFRTGNRIEKRENFQVLDGRDYIDDSLLTVFTAIILSWRTVDEQYPLVAYCNLKEKPGLVKISARCRDILVKKGVNLGAAIRDTMNGLNMEGTCRGHAPAATAEIPEKMLEKFFKNLDRRVISQLQPMNKGNDQNLNWI